MVLKTVMLRCFRLWWCRVRTLLLGRGNASYITTTKFSRKVFDSAVAVSPTWPRHCRVRKLSTRLQWRLLLGHGESKSESLPLGRDDASYSSMMKSSQKVFYSAAAGSPTWDGVKLASLLLVRGNTSYSAMMKSSRKVFYSALTPSSQKAFY